MGRTVAILLSISGIIPPKEWHHDPLITGKNRFTVADNLIYN